MARTKQTARKSTGGKSCCWRRPIIPSPGPRPRDESPPMLGRTRGAAKRAGWGLFEALFMKFPVEITQEILSYVAPPTLLALSRSCKRARQELMFMSAKSVWIRSMQDHSSILPCPDDLTVPQYIALLYDQECTYCNEPVQTAHVTYRVRCCSDCFWKHFATEVTAKIIMRSDTFKVLQSLLVPVTGLIEPVERPTYGRLFILRDVLEVLDASRQMEEGSDEWQEYTQGRLKLLDEMVRRRQATYQVKGWMIRNHLLKDRRDYLCP